MSATKASCSFAPKFKQVAYWMVVYAFMDSMVFGFLYHINLVYNVEGHKDHVSDLTNVWAYPLLGLVGKSSLIPQFPVMLFIVYVFRFSVVRITAIRVCLPSMSFIFAYILFLILTTALDYSDSWEVAMTALGRELGRWAAYEYALNSVRPIALLSAVLATFPWLFYLRWTIKKLH